MANTLKLVAGAGEYIGCTNKFLFYDCVILGKALSRLLLLGSIKTDLKTVLRLIWQYCGRQDTVKIERKIKLDIKKELNIQ